MPLGVRVPRRRRCRCRRCSARCCRSPPGSAWSSCTRARATSGFGWMALRAGALRRLPHDAGQVADQARASCPRRRCGARRRASSSTARSSCRCSATPLDDDIIQTAGRLAGRGARRLDAERGRRRSRRCGSSRSRWRCRSTRGCPTPSSSGRGRRCGAPRRWGRSTRASRSRRRPCARGGAGQAIVEEARRRGVEAIVLAAEEPSRIRGGALLGGRGGPLDNFVGDVTKYVVSKAPCRVILTAPPAADRRRPARRPEPAAAEQTRLESPSMFVLIVGAGRVGSAVARSALAAGHEVSVLDEDPLSHERLDAGWRRPGRTPAGASRSATRSRSTRCEEAGIERPTSSSPRPTATTRTSTIAQIAKRRFEVERVIVRVMDPARAAWYAEQGLADDLPDASTRSRSSQTRSAGGLDVRRSSSAAARSAGTSPAS